MWCWSEASACFYSCPYWWTWGTPVSWPWCRHWRSWAPYSRRRCLTSPRRRHKVPASDPALAETRWTPRIDGWGGFYKRSAGARLSVSWLGDQRMAAGVRAWADLNSEGTLWHYQADHWTCYSSQHSLTLRPGCWLSLTARHMMYTELHTTALTSITTNTLPLFLPHISNFTYEKLDIKLLWTKVISAKWTSRIFFWFHIIIYNQVNVNGKEITPPKVSNARTPFSGIFFLINVLNWSISSSVSITFLEVTQQETFDF